MLLKFTQSRFKVWSYQDRCFNKTWDKPWLFEFYQEGNSETKDIQDRFDDMDSKAGETHFGRDFISAVIYVGF